MPDARRRALYVLPLPDGPERPMRIFVFCRVALRRVREFIDGRGSQRRRVAKIKKRNAIMKPEEMTAMDVIR